MRTRLQCFLPIVILLGVSACGKKLATVQLDGIGDTKVQKVNLAEGTTVRFPVSIDEYSFSGGYNYLMIEAGMLKDDQVVENFRCRGFEFDGISGSGSRSSQYRSNCSTKIPAGGVDALRVSTSLDRSNGQVEVKGLAVEIRVPR